MQTAQGACGSRMHSRQIDDERPPSRPLSSRVFRHVGLLWLWRNFPCLFLSQPNDFPPLLVAFLLKELPVVPNVLIVNEAFHGTRPQLASRDNVIGFAGGLNFLELPTK
jgi:hypothetical protein